MKFRKIDGKIKVNLDKTSKAHKFLLEVTELQLEQKYSVNIYEAEAFDSDIFRIENDEFCYGIIGIAGSWIPAIIFWFIIIRYCLCF